MQPDTLIILICATAGAAVLTFLIGFMMTKVENDWWIGLIGMLVAAVSELCVQTVEGDDVLWTTTFLKDVGYAVGGATLLMLVILAVVRRNRAKADKARSNTLGGGFSS